MNKTRRREGTVEDEGAWRPTVSESEAGTRGTTESKSWVTTVDGRRESTLKTFLTQSLSATYELMTQSHRGARLVSPPRPVPSPSNLPLLPYWSVPTDSKGVTSTTPTPVKGPVSLRDTWGFVQEKCLLNCLL